MELLTNSRMSCARACLRKHLIRYEYGLRPDVDDVPKRIGSAFHRAMEADDRGEDAIEAVRSFNLDAFDEETVLRLVMGHRWRWQADKYEAVVPEQEFLLLLRNPETGASTPNWRSAGKMDRIVRLGDGRLALQEYKTTSEDLAPGAEYWARVRLDTQVALYFLAAREIGFDVQTVIYDVTRKPGLRPLKATPEESRKYKKDTGDLYANQRADDETREEYGERINDDIAARPDWYFARMEIPMLAGDLELYESERWQQQLALRSAQKTGHWFRNPGSCRSHYGSCEYLPICHRGDLENTVPDGFIRLAWVHPELSSPEASPATSTATQEASPALSQ